MKERSWLVSVECYLPVKADMRDNSLISFMQVENPTANFDIPHKISWTLCSEQVIDAI